MLSIDDAARLYSQSCLRGFERCLFERMKDPDLELLSEFAMAFKINRQFPNPENPDRYSKVLAFLKQREPARTIKELIGQVAELTEKSGALTRTPSAASKFLWARSPCVGVITDSRARRSLSREIAQLSYEKRGRADDYRVHADRWYALYQAKEDNLVCSARRFGLEEPWAARRLLDYWLYRNG